MRTFYFYLDIDTLEIKRQSDKPEVVYNTFVMSNDLNEDAVGNPILPENWRSNATLLLRILRYKRAALIDKTKYILSLEDVITAQELLDWKAYWAALYNLPTTAVMDGITLDTLNTLFPIPPTAGIIAQMN